MLRSATRVFPPRLTGGWRPYDQVCRACTSCQRHKSKSSRALGRELARAGDGCTSPGCRSGAFASPRVYERVAGVRCESCTYVAASTMRSLDREARVSVAVEPSFTMMTVDAGRREGVTTMDKPMRLPFLAEAHDVL